MAQDLLNNILLLTLLAPALAAVLVFALGSNLKKARALALGLSFIPLILSILVYVKFTQSPLPGAFQLLESYPWIQPLNIEFTLGVDGISLPLVILTTLLTTLAIAFSWDVAERSRLFFTYLLVMELCSLGVFMSLNFFLFYIFWELQLIPMYFLITLWGGPRRDYAAIKFVLFTIAGGVLVLFGISALFAQTGTFDMVTIINAAKTFTPQFQLAVFLLTFIGFGVKLPIIPLHTWLPDAHVEAPTAGSVILAGVLLKMGGYGMIRISYSMAPQGATALAPLVIGIAFVSIIVGAILCLPQKDLKRLIAYSSVSHMGIVVLGLAAFNAAGFSGAVFQMFSHGLISAALFMLAGAIHHKTGTRLIPELGGVTSKMPIGGGILTAAAFASAGLPGMSGFVAEFLSFFAAYGNAIIGIWVIVPIVYVVITAGYFLWALQRAFFGPFNEKLEHVHDLDLFEIVPLLILLALTALFGIYPALLLNPIAETSGNLVAGLGG